MIIKLSVLFKTVSLAIKSTEVDCSTIGCRPRVMLMFLSLSSEGLQYSRVIDRYARLVNTSKPQIEFMLKISESRRLTKTSTISS